MSHQSAQEKVLGWSTKVRAQCVVETAGVDGTLRNSLQGRSRGPRLGPRATASGDKRNRQAAARWAGGSSRNQRKEDLQEGTSWQGQQLSKPSRLRTEVKWSS